MSIPQSPPAAPVPPEERSRIPWPLRLLFILSLLILLMASWAEMVRLNDLEPTHAAGVAANDNQILPGQRVGFITLGVSISEVEARLGAGRIRPTEHAVLYNFVNAGLTCGVEGGRVTFILTHSPAFKLRTEVAVGSDVEMVVRTFGDGYEYERKSGNAPAPVKVGPATPSPTPSAAVSPSPRPTPDGNALEGESYTLHYWEKGIHFNVRGSRVESILVTAPLGA